MNTWLLLLILLTLLINSYLFWTHWWEDQRKRQAEIEHVLRLMVTYRRAKAAEDVGQAIHHELLAAIQHDQEQRLKRVRSPR